MAMHDDRFLSGSGFSFSGTVPLALTVAGSDSGGGAGIQADLKTFTAFGVFGTSAITAITAQNTLGVTQVMALEPSLVEAQIDAVLEDIGTDAAKTGMLASKAIVEAVALSLNKHGVTRLVVDPVMVAASGHRLLDADAVEALKEHLFPLALVITPNLPEAAALTQQPIDSLAAMVNAARNLVQTGCRYVVIKGGHLPMEVAESDGELSRAAGMEGPVSVLEIEAPPPPVYPWGRPETASTGRVLSGRFAIDVIYDGQKVTLLKSPHIQTRNTHGTGCTFSAAIAAGLALGLEPIKAIVEAKRFVTQAVRYSLALGRGHGPTNHLLRFSPAAQATGPGGWAHEAVR